MAEQIPFAHMPDDHEWDINNVAVGDPASDAVIDAFAEGTTDYLIGNPVNSDSSDTNPLYFAFECGDAEVFVLNNTLHCKDATAAQRGLRDQPAAGAACLGRDAAGVDVRNQEDWLIAELGNSTKTYKIVLNPKMTLYSTNTNADSFGIYTTERDRVLQAIHDNSSGWTVPGGCIWGAGDWHSPGIHASENGVDSATYDHVNVTACPMKNDIKDAGAASDWTLYHYTGAVIDSEDHPTYRPYFGLFGLMETSSAQVTGKIMNFGGTVLSSVSVATGTNKAS